MSATLADGSEARQQGSKVFYRRAGSSEWLTGTAPRSATIVDFGISALRAVQSTDGTELGRGALSVTTKDGFVAKVEQKFDSPVSVVRRTEFDKFGRKLVIDIPDEGITRPATVQDCEARRGGPHSLVCAQVLVDDWIRR